MNKQWFKDQFKRVGKPQSALARELNVEPSAISRALSGLRRFKADEVPYIASFFGVTNDEVMEAIHGPDFPITKKKNPASKALITGKIDTHDGAIVEYFDINSDHPADHSYAIAFKSPQEYENRRFIGLTIAGDNHPAFPAGTDLIFATADDNELQDGKTYLYEVHIDGTHYQCIGRGITNNQGEVSLVFEGNDRTFREHVVDNTVSQGQGMQLQERASTSFISGAARKPRADEKPAITIKGILVKSVKNE